MNKVKILFKSAESRKAFFIKLFTFNPGWAWHLGLDDESVFVEDIETRWPAEKYEGTEFFLNSDDLTGRIQGTGASLGIPEEHAESVLNLILNTKLPARPLSVKLNDNHTALVTATGIKVGCQTCPIDIVEKLTAAIAEIQSRKVQQARDAVITDAVPT